MKPKVAKRLPNSPHSQMPKWLADLVERLAPVGGRVILLASLQHAKATGRIDQRTLDTALRWLESTGTVGEKFDPHD